MKSKGFLALLIAATLFAQNASALPVGDKWLYDSLPDVAFSIGSGSALVDCEVYKYTSGDYVNEYVYTYQISNVDSGVGLSLFSVGILPGADAYDPNFELLPGVVAPASWSVVTSGVVESVNGLFTSVIESGGLWSASVPLWFVSDSEPILGNGALFGTSSGIPYYATGDLLTPVPEPATLTLFGIGVLITLTRRRRPA